MASFLLMAPQKNYVTYIGRIKSKLLENQEFQIKYLRRYGNSNRFYYPLKEDISSDQRERVKKKLKAANNKYNSIFSTSFENYEREFGRILCINGYLRSKLVFKTRVLYR